MTEQVNTRNFIVMLAIVIEGGLVLVAWFLGWLFEQPPLSRFDPSIEAVLWGLLGTLPMLVLFVVIERWPVGPLRSLQQFTAEVLRPLMWECSLVDLLGIACLAGFGEELVFRGVLQDALESNLGTWTAVVLASVLFGLMHAVSVTYAVLAAGMGMYLGWLYLQTGNLLAPMVTHALYDFVVLVWVLRGPGSDEMEADEDAEEGEEESEEGQRPWS